MSARVLVAGIGNVFFGDDAFGCAVAERLARRAWPADPNVDVKVEDFGIRGLDLAFALTGGAYDAAVLVDVARRGGAPGTLYVIAPEVSADTPAELVPHGMDPARVLALARAMDVEGTGALPVIRLVACEASPDLETSEMEATMSPEVLAAIAPAADLVVRLVAELAGARRDA